MDSNPLSLVAFLYIAIALGLSAGAVWISRAPVRRLLRGAADDPKVQVVEASFFSDPRIELQDDSYRLRLIRRVKTSTWCFEIECVAFSQQMTMRVHRLDVVTRLLARKLINRDAAHKRSPTSGMRFTSSDDDLLRAILKQENVQHAFAALIRGLPRIQNIELDDKGVLRCEYLTRDASYATGRAGVMLLLQLARALDEHRLDKRLLSPQMRVQLTGIGAQSGRPIAIAATPPASD